MPRPSRGPPTALAVHLGCGSLRPRDVLIAGLIEFDRHYGELQQALGASVGAISSAVVPKMLFLPRFSSNPRSTASGEARHARISVCHGNVFSPLTF
jgi:hypothetical protein